MISGGKKNDRNTLLKPSMSYTNQHTFTILYTIRDREIDRIRNSIQSLLDHGVQAHFLVVDYGSKPEIRLGLKELAQKIPFTLMTMETQGLPWNKSHAINYGIRHISTPWVATSDMDMIYDCNPFEYCSPRLSEGQVFVMHAWWLNKQGDKSRAEFGEKRHPGGFVLLERSAFDRLGGYNEGIRYWGEEDWDWFDRLVRVGYTVSWLPETYRFYHVWHSTEANKLKPMTANYDTACCKLRGHFDPVNRMPWGRAITKTDRPILSALEQKENELVVHFSPGRLTNKIERLISALTQARLVRLELGSRYIKRKLSWAKHLVRTLLQDVVVACGLTFKDQVNENFDVLYSMIPTLKEFVLEDWYVSENQETVWLLSKRHKDESKV